MGDIILLKFYDGLYAAHLWSLIEAIANFLWFWCFVLLEVERRASSMLDEGWAPFPALQCWF